jgi:hypothetical protein
MPPIYVGKGIGQKAYKKSYVSTTESTCPYLIFKSLEVENNSFAYQYSILHCLIYYLKFNP